MKIIKFLFLTALLALSEAGPTNLEWYGVGRQTFYGCYYAMSSEEVSFSETAYDYTVFCSDENALATLAGCYYVGHRNSSKNYQFWIDTCESYLLPITEKNITDGLQYYFTNATDASLWTGIPETPVIMQKSNVSTALDAYTMFLGNYNHSVYYGAGAVAYWALVCFVAGIANWSVILFPRLRHVFNGKISRIWRKYVTLPALVRRKKSTTQSLWKLPLNLVPSRFETTVLFFFFWLLFAICAAEIHYVKHDPIFPSKAIAINRYVADRTGIICVLLMPFLLLFGGRNNFMIWVTRWKFSTFMTYHRWLARAVVLLAFIHSMGYIRVFILYDEVAEESAYTYVIWGYVGTFVGVVIMFQGLLFLRKAYYDTFLVLHIILAAFFVIGTWYHIYELGYSQIMYPCFAIWAFDRIVRWVRLAIFGFPTAEISLSSDETIRVVIKKPSYWRATPGGHAYVYFLTPFKFWQSHPFTYVESEGCISFYCKVKSGITQTLHKKLINLPGNKMKLRVGVEGPYGTPAPVEHHSDVVLLAGGNGIPGIYSEFEHLSRSGNTKQRLKLKWVIRELKSFSWMYKEFKAYNHTNAEITVYVTRPDKMEGTEELASFLSSDNSSSEESKEEKAVSNNLFEHLKLEFPFIEFLEGRPNLKEMIETDIQEAANSVAFVVCGVTQMVDEVRYQVVQNIDKTEKRVDYFEELEVWA